MTICQSKGVVKHTEANLLSQHIHICDQYGIVSGVYCCHSYLLHEQTQYQQGPIQYTIPDTIRTYILYNIYVELHERKHTRGNTVRGTRIAFYIPEIPSLMMSGIPQMMSTTLSITTTRMAM